MLNDLPTELLNHISSYLFPRDLVSLSAVSRLFYSWSRDQTLWIDAFRCLSVCHPEKMLDTDEELLREIPDLQAFYTRIIEPNWNLLGVWQNVEPEYEHDAILAVKVNLAMSGIVGQQIDLYYQTSGRPKPCLQFIIPMDVYACKCDFKQVECTRGCVHKHSTSRVVVEPDSFHLKCSYVTSCGFMGRLRGDKADQTKSWKTFYLQHHGGLVHGGLFIEDFSSCTTVLRSGLFFCDEREKIMLLQSDTNGISVKKRLGEWDRGSSVTIDMSKPVDLETTLHLFFCYNRDQAFDLDNNIVYLDRFVNPVRAKDLSTLRTKFQLSNIEPAHFGLTEDYKYLEAFSCRTFLSTGGLILEKSLLCIVTSHDSFSVLQHNLIGEGNYHLTRVPGITSTI